MELCTETIVIQLALTHRSQGESDLSFAEQVALAAEKAIAHLPEVEKAVAHPVARMNRCPAPPPTHPSGR